MILSVTYVSYNNVYLYHMRERELHKRNFELKY